MDRMTENKKLIRQLDRIREEKKDLERKQKVIELEIQTLKLQKNKRINDQNNFQEKLYDLYKKVSKSKSNEFAPNDHMQSSGTGLIAGVDKSQAAEGKPIAKPKGRLYKGTPFLRGNTEDKLMIQNLEVSNNFHVISNLLFSTSDRPTLKTTTSKSFCSNSKKEVFKSK